MLEEGDRPSGKSSKEVGKGPRAVQISLEFFVTWPKSGSAPCELHKAPSFDCLVTKDGNQNCLEEQGTVKELDFVAVEKAGGGQGGGRKSVLDNAVLTEDLGLQQHLPPSTKFQATILFLWEIMQVISEQMQNALLAAS